MKNVCPLGLNLAFDNCSIMKSKRELIEEKAIEFLLGKPKGIRTSQLVNALIESLPDVHPKTINGTVWKLPAKRPEEVYKPSRGLFRHVSFQEE